VTTAGLLAGEDLLANLERDGRLGDVCLLPAEALNADELFIDSMSLDQLRARLPEAVLVPAFDLIDGLHDAAAAVRVPRGIA
jgi:hypothetical protein